MPKLDQETQSNISALRQAVATQQGLEFVSVPRVALEGTLNALEYGGSYATVLPLPPARKMKNPCDSGPIPGAVIAERMLQICGCKGCFDCDCVSVQNLALQQLWGERNTGEPYSPAR